MSRHVRPVLVLLLLSAASTVAARPAIAQDPSDGALRLASGTYCPLTHTGVAVEITGLLARVTVTQTFVNPTSDRVEAVYTFPLPQRAAVDDLTMTVGDRVIRGLVKPREEARRLYEQARETGRTAALLEQQRPNVFTQSVANIPPRSPVTIEISYLEIVGYEAGRYAFVFPMVVGPRYVPGTATGRTGGGWSPDTSQVPDASRITPPVAGVHVGTRGSRAGHDISITIALDAGVPIHSISSPTHEIDVEQPRDRLASVRLRGRNEIPNRDFVLVYDTSGRRIEDAVITHAPAGARGGYVALLLQPPDEVPEVDVTPRELVFVLDTSGSMSGYPIDTAKAVIRRALRSLRIGDTFNLVTFAGHTRVLFDEPVEATISNVETALAMIEDQSGGGGTEMMTAIRTALGSGVCESPADCGAGTRRAARGSAIRVVCFLTDGYVGNDMAIVGEVQKHPEARVFGFGIGSSVNRFLLDGMSRAGRGEVEYVLRAEDAAAAADRFFDRIDRPVLTDISVEWGALPVEEITPARVPDLFAARPIVVLGRYRDAASGVVTLRGQRGGRPFSRATPVNLPASQPAARAIAQLWARERIEQLSAGDWAGLQRGSMRDDLKKQITELGIRFRLMTPFTSLVAVEQRTIVEGGQRRTIEVPVEMSANVRAEGVFAEADAQRQASASMRVGGNLQVSSVAAVPGGVVGGMVGGVPEAVAPPAAMVPSPRPTTVRDRTEVAPRPVRRGTSADPLAAKLHVSLMALLDCVRQRPAPARAALCRDAALDAVAVRVLLTARAGSALFGRLREAGLAIDSDTAGAGTRRVAGRIAAGKLAALAAIPEVRLIAAPAAGTLGEARDR